MCAICGFGLVKHGICDMCGFVWAKKQEPKNNEQAAESAAPKIPQPQE